MQLASTAINIVGRLEALLLAVAHPFKAWEIG